MLVAITLLLVIWGLNAITIIYTITRGGPANRTLITPIQIFRTAFELFQFNQAAALSVMFFAVTVVFVAIYIRVFGAANTEERGREDEPARLARSSASAPRSSSSVCVFPFVWMALSSIKTLGELYTVPPVWLPEVPTFDNYRKVLFESNIPRYFLNCDGDLARRDGAGARPRDLRVLRLRPLPLHGQDRSARPSILLGQLLPTAAIIVPLFVTLRVLGLVNTYLGLILVYMIITLPL